MRKALHLLPIYAGTGLIIPHRLAIQRMRSAAEAALTLLGKPLTHR
jgi:hypothetical protein